VKVDEHVPATDQIEVRERRVADDVLPGEDAEVADGFGDAVPALLRDEEAPESLGGDMGRDAVRVDAGSSSRD